MIPRSTSNETFPSGNRGRGRKTKGTGYPYLTTAQLSNEPQEVTIQGARVEADSFRPGNQVVALKLAFKGSLFLLNLRPGNPNLDILGDGLGDDETQWLGKRVMFFNEEDDFNGKTWMRCTVPTQAGKKK